MLPWHTLFGGPAVISQLEIDSPRVDLDALQAWMAALPAQTQQAPLNIPRIDTGVEITHGSVVRGNEVLLDNVSIRAGSIRDGVTAHASPTAGTSDLLAVPR